MSSESFPIKEKRIRIRFPFCRRCVIMHGYRVQCASARCFGRSHPHQIIQYPGIAKLVSRLVWERSSVYPWWKQPKPGTPCNTGVCGISPDRKTWPKTRFDHINDHRQNNLWFSPSPWYHGRNWISGCGSTGRARHLGCRGWVFKSPHSDQNPSEIIDFRGIFLILCLLRRRRYKEQLYRRSL